MMKNRIPDLAIHSNQTLINEELNDATVLIKTGKILDVIPGVAEGINCPLEDVGDLVLMPGLVDTHVHINEPGRTEWEGFETATKSAAAGGITTLVDMPLNSSPVTTTAAAFQLKLEAAKDKLFVNCGFWGGIVPGNTMDLDGLIEAGVLGIKAFLAHSGIDDFPNVTEKDLRAGMPILAKHNIPLLVHSELADEKTTPRWPEMEQGSYGAWLDSRPKSWEDNAIRMMIELCGDYHCRTHIVHLSSADSITQIKTARSAGLPLTVETCPHYLYFSSERIPDGDTRYKCAPPIREKANNDLLWDALKNGWIDFIVTDHSPSTPSLKQVESGNLKAAWGGIASLQFSLAVVWTAAREKGFTINDVARWMCSGPARFIGLENKKGKIAPGFDADLIAWDPDKVFTLTQSMIHHRHKITPYENQTFYGAVNQTYVNGMKVYDGGEFVNSSAGELILRKQA